MLLRLVLRPFLRLLLAALISGLIPSAPRPPLTSAWDNCSLSHAGAAARSTDGKRSDRTTIQRTLQRPARQRSPSTGTILCTRPKTQCHSGQPPGSRPDCCLEYTYAHCLESPDQFRNNLL
jgi:hypothetical protein